MSPAQTAMYFSLWGRVRDIYKAKGLPCGDVQRHALHKKALGVMKSSKDFTNGDVDKIKAVMLAIVEPANLDAQLGQIDQPVYRKSDLIEECRDLARRCVAKPGVEKFYLDGMARKIFGMPHGHCQLNEPQLAKLRGILLARHRQLDRAEGRVVGANPF